MFSTFPSCFSLIKLPSKPNTESFYDSVSLGCSPLIFVKKSGVYSVSHSGYFPKQVEPLPSMWKTYLCVFKSRVLAALAQGENTYNLLELHPLRVICDLAEDDVEDRLSAVLLPLPVSWLWHQLNTHTLVRLTPCDALLLWLYYDSESDIPVKTVKPNRARVATPLWDLWCSWVMWRAWTCVHKKFMR